jgi:hypothetical protein
MMEYWNIGMVVLRNSISFKIDIFIFIPNIPLFHHSSGEHKPGYCKIFINTIRY